MINVDFPRNIEEYVHRVGRTGRAGKTGTSITFVENRDRKNARDLINILEKAKQEVPGKLKQFKMNGSYRILQKFVKATLIDCKIYLLQVNFSKYFFFHDSNFGFFTDLSSALK